MTAYNAESKPKSFRAIYEWDYRYFPEQNKKGNVFLLNKVGYLAVPCKISISYSHTSHYDKQTLYS